MEGLLGGEGVLEKLSTHDAVLSSHSAPSKIITKEADKVAQDALSALRKSRNATKKYTIGTPTWTGKFGQAGKISKKKLTSKKTTSGSFGILNNIKKAQSLSPELNSSPSPNIQSDEVIESKNTLKKIEQYLNSKEDNFASSADIVKNIGITLSEKDDLIKARALLKTIAHFDQNKKGWILNDEFRK